MLAGVVVIGTIGLALEKLVFQKIEEFTVMRWGMMTVSDPARPRTRSITCARTVTIARGRRAVRGAGPHRCFAAALIADIARPSGGALVGRLLDGTMIEHATTPFTA